MKSQVMVLPFVVKIIFINIISEKMACGCKGKGVSKPLQQSRTMTQPTRVIRKQQSVNAKPALAPNRKVIVTRKRI